MNAEVRRDPRAVFGMPAYGRVDRLAQVLESLLGQTCQDFAIVIVDDKPSPEASAIVETYAALDRRITYEPNPTRLGMIGNWRKAFDRGRELHPHAEFFAWVSDHDIWHPRWLEVLIGELDADPDVVLAYPQIQRVYATHRRILQRGFQTRGLKTPRARIRVTASGMTAGNCIYGLFRSDALAQAGVFRAVLAPDRQVLMALLLLGEFSLVNETLWYREVAGEFSYGRQRRMFFPTHVPLHTYLPAAVQHLGLAVWDFGIRGRGLPKLSRREGIACAFVQFWYEVRRELMKDDARWRLILENTRFGAGMRARRERMAARAAMQEADASEAAE